MGAAPPGRAGGYGVRAAMEESKTLFPAGSKPEPPPRIRVLSLVGRTGFVVYVPTLHRGFRGGHFGFVATSTARCGADGPVPGSGDPRSLFPAAYRTGARDRRPVTMTGARHDRLGRQGKTGRRRVACFGCCT